MVFVREVESSFPYTNPINLIDLQERLQQPSEGGMWPPPMEPDRVNEWIGFIHTALTTLKGQGELGYAAEIEYTVKFAGTPERRNSLIFHPESDTLYYSCLDGKTSVNMCSVQSVTQIDDSTIVIKAGETSITNLTVSANGQVNLSVEP